VYFCDFCGYTEATVFKTKAGALCKECQTLIRATEEQKEKPTRELQEMIQKLKEK
jgi:hypothetical protein